MLAIAGSESVVARHIPALHRLSEQDAVSVTSLEHYPILHTAKGELQGNIASCLCAPVSVFEDKDGCLINFDGKVSAIRC